MNIKNLDKGLCSEVRQDKFKNSIRVGDAVYFTTNQLYGICLGVIAKFCPIAIKINNGQNEYSVADFDIVKVNTIMNDDLINNLKEKVSKIYNEKEKYRKIITRYVWFIYKDRINGERGIGWWMLSDLKKNHKSIIANNIKKMNANNYDIWFANYNKTTDSIYFDDIQNSIPKDSGLFIKSKGTHLTYVEHMRMEDKNEIRLFKHIEDKKLKEKISKRMKTLIENFKTKKSSNRTLFYKNPEDLFLKYDSDILFEAIPPKKGKIVEPYNEGVRGNSIMVDNKMIIINCLNESSFHDDYYNINNIEASLIEFKKYALNNIDLKFNWTDDKIKSFFNTIKDKLNSI